MANQPSPLELMTQRWALVLFELYTWTFAPSEVEAPYTSSRSPVLDAGANSYSPLKSSVVLTNLQPQLERFPVPSASIGFAYKSLPEEASLNTRPTPGWKPMFHATA